MQILISACALLLLTFSLCYAIEDDLHCLEGLKNSTTDPLGRLASWDFKNKTPGSICNLYGVSCWSDKESRIINLELKNSELSGKLPESLQYCRSLQSLDLSNNSFFGSIPSSICTWFPYLVTLDQSYNSFSGSIPSEIASCTYLNSLILNENDLSGSIPDSFNNNLTRLKRFTVADNKLSGWIPGRLANFSESDFDRNDGLCGKPLDICGGGLSGKNVAVIVVCGVGGTAFGLLVWWKLHFWRRKK